MSLSPPSLPEKRLFVTVGATAPFHALISAVLQPSFLAAITHYGFTHLRIQHGGSQQFKFFIDAIGDRVQADTGVKVSGFDFDKAGLQMELKAVKGEKGGVNAGTIISHAGSGSVLDALRVGLPVVVVPNEELLGNHQVELAEVLGKMENLAMNVAEAEQLRHKMKKWPPHTSGVDRYEKGIDGVIHEEMAWQLDGK